MLLDDLMDALADDRFRALRNHGDEWSIEYVLDDGEVSTMRSADLNQLVDRFVEMLAEADLEDADLEDMLRDDDRR